MLLLTDTLLMNMQGFLDCTRKCIAARGVLSLWTGYPTFVARICPHIMLTWVFMDTINGSLKGMGM